MARVSDLRALRRNDEKLTSLQLLRAETDTSPVALRRIVEALKNTNSRVKRIRLFLPRDFFLADEEEEGVDDEDEFDQVEETRVRGELLRVVSELPQLEELKIDAYSGMAEFPVALLADTVFRARHLKELELWDLNLALFLHHQNPVTTTEENGSSSSSDDLKTLELSLKNHPSLEKFTLYNCQLRENTICTLDPLLHGLAAIPTLKQVYITAAAAASTASASVSFTCNALEDLCRSKSLQELGLWKFNNFHYNSNNSNNNTNPHPNPQQRHQRGLGDPITQMAPVIAKSNTLKMFEFGKCQLTRVGDEALAAMLETNTSLEEIDLHMDWSTTTTTTTATGSGHPEDACEIVATATALKKQNTTLKRLKLWGLMNRRNQEALAKMMRHNYTLETCRLLDADRDISAEIDFFIGLNRGGRKHFLTNDAAEAMTKQWIDMLASADLSTIFYYLSMKPGFFQIHCR